jgi:hypothetical protein
VIGEETCHPREPSFTYYGLLPSIRNLDQSMMSLRVHTAEICKERGTNNDSYVFFSAQVMDSCTEQDADNEICE